jgi:superfamily II DNA or RNA helicase
VGLTATPRRTDGIGLDHLYTDIVQPITMREAIEAGYLARPLCIVPKEYHLKVAIHNGDYDPAEQAALLGEPQIIGDVIGNYGDIFAGLPVLVACSTYDHAEMMTDAFNAAGWRFSHIHSGLAKADRRRMLREIRTGKLNGLCTVGIGIEGMDIPGLYGLIWLRRTMSLTIYLQFIGRVLRPMKGKKYGIILDPVGNLFIHGFPDADRRWSLGGNADVGSEAALTDAPPTMRICPACGVANAITNTVCHFCGLSFDSATMREARMRHLPAMVDGELVVVQSDGQAEALHERSESVRAAIQAETKKEAHIVPIELTKNERAGILREGLFTNRRPLFAEAVRGMK